jgi:hypothetical protein
LSRLRCCELDMRVSVREQAGGLCWTLRLGTAWTSSDARVSMLACMQNKLSLHESGSSAGKRPGNKDRRTSPFRHSHLVTQKFHYGLDGMGQ